MLDSIHHLRIVAVQPESVLAGDNHSLRTSPRKSKVEIRYLITIISEIFRCLREISLNQVIESFSSEGKARESKHNKKCRLNYKILHTIKKIAETKKQQKNLTFNCPDWLLEFCRGVIFQTSKYHWVVTLSPSSPPSVTTALPPVRIFYHLSTQFRKFEILNHEWTWRMKLIFQQNLINSENILSAGASTFGVIISLDVHESMNTAN